jgi:hypothetical protein
VYVAIALRMIVVPMILAGKEEEKVRLRTKKRGELPKIERATSRAAKLPAPSSRPLWEGKSLGESTLQRGSSFFG